MDSPTESSQLVVKHNPYLDHHNPSTPNEDLAGDEGKLWKRKFNRKPRDRIKEKAKDREREREDELQSILVFGYQCTLFDDPEGANNLKSGAKLIPWQGDESLMLDRFDARNLLDDRKKFQKIAATVVLRKEDQEMEALCEEERYRDLRSDDLMEMAEEERETYREEIVKREKMAREKGDLYKTFAFDYGTEVAEAIDSVEREEALQREEDEQTERRRIQEEEEAKRVEERALEEAQGYEPKFEAPEGMVIPKTQRHAEIVEKTALFLNKGDKQMEIILRTKQARNPHFNFLSPADELHRYYKHLRFLISSGLYEYSLTEVSAKPIKPKKTIVVKRKVRVKIQKPSVEVPEDTQKLVVDKTAERVAQHGAALEKTVRENKKDDPKFAFLNPDHVLNLYYQKKLREHKGEKSDSEEEVEQDVEEEVDASGDEDAPAEKFAFIPDDDFRSYLESLEQKIEDIPLPAASDSPKKVQEEGKEEGAQKPASPSVASEADAKAERRKRAMEFLQKKKQEKSESTPTPQTSSVPSSAPASPTSGTQTPVAALEVPSTLEPMNVETESVVAEVPVGVEQVETESEVAGDAAPEKELPEPVVGNDAPVPVSQLEELARHDVPVTQNEDLIREETPVKELEETPKVVEEEQAVSSFPEAPKMEVLETVAPAENAKVPGEGSKAQARSRPRSVSSSSSARSSSSSSSSRSRSRSRSRRRKKSSSHSQRKGRDRKHRRRSRSRSRDRSGDRGRGRNKSRSSERKSHHRSRSKSRRSGHRKRSRSRSRSRSRTRHQSRDRHKARRKDSPQREKEDPGKSTLASKVRDMLSKLN